jgi:cell division protein FtsB
VNGIRRRVQAHRYRAAWSVHVRDWYHAARERTTLYARALALATVALCAALLFATSSQALVNQRLADQVRAEQEANARLRADIAATNRHLVWATAPATIEAEARALGYIRPGERAIVIVPPVPAAPAKGSASPVAPAGDWWRDLIGG